MRGYVWAMHEMTHFGEMASRALEMPLIVGAPIGDCDVVHIVGMMDAPSYGHTMRNTARANRRVIHWCGYDVVMLTRPDLIPEAVHVCDAEALRCELSEFDIEATVVPWPTPYHFDATPLPEQKQVAVYLGRDADHYGRATSHAVDDSLPDVTFRPYVFDELDEEGMRELVAQTTVYLRPTVHDGGAVSAKEYLEAGRRVVMSGQLPHATTVAHDDLSGVLAAVKHALDFEEPDLEAAAFWKTQNTDERFRAELRGVL